jgi:diguanylate cyclase (GGDEF)-like protein
MQKKSDLTSAHLEGAVPDPILNLSLYRDRVYFWFSVIVILAMIPISVNNFIQERLIMGYTGSCVAVVFLVNVFDMRLRGSKGINKAFTLIPVMFALPIAVHQMGVVGVFWSYTGIMLVTLILPVRTGLYYILALLALVTPVIFFALAPLEASRAFITLSLVAMLASIFAKVIETQQHELITLIGTDQLTGAFNRYRMEEELEKAISMSARYNTKTSLAVLDIDHFKKLNDEKGHLEGDQALIRIVELIKKRLRDTDMLFRFGGEEFVILLHETSLEQAAPLTDEIRTLVENENIIDGWALTISGGVTEMAQGESRDVLLARADDALYLAKDQGRNRIVTI